MAGHYLLADDEAHLRALLPYFHDPRYIRIHNKPLFLVYRASRLPDPRATTALWRQLAQQHGLDGLYLVKVESFPTERNRHPELDGFDVALDFQPDWGSLPPPLQPPLRWKLLHKLGLYGSTPSAYGLWLRTVLADQQTLDQLPETFVFINAWNEWAEGNYLEPDLRWKHDTLSTTNDSSKTTPVFLDISAIKP